MSSGECPNSADGNHNISSHTHTEADGSTKTVWSCSSCGMEWSY